MNLTVAAISNPSGTTDNNGGVICSVYTTAYATKANRFASGASMRFLTIGGIAGGQPDCTSYDAAGKVACFAKAWNSGIYGSLCDGKGWAGADWSPYGGIGGEVSDNANCTSQIAGELVCGATAIDSNFYGNVWTGSAWLGWVKVGGPTVGSPACAPLGTGQVVCVIMGPANKLSSLVGP